MPSSFFKTLRHAALAAWLALLLVTCGLGGCGNPPEQQPAPTIAASSQTAASAPVATPPAPTPRTASTPVEAVTGTAPLRIGPAESIPLTGGWRFAVDPGGAGENEGWAAPDLDDSEWTAVTIPHTWGVMVEHAVYEGIAWYRRSFTLPTEAQDAHLRLRFDAVFYLAHVWLNGVYLGEHEGGYTPFEFDVSGIAQPGAGNVIAVRVDNVRGMDRIPAVLRRDWSFDWWNWGGLVREVSLEMTSSTYIAHQEVVAVPALAGIDDADRAAVNTTVTLHNASVDRLEATVVADVVDDTSGLSALDSPATLRVSLAPGQSTVVKLMAEIPEPKLWHFDHPNLYRWSASLLSSGGEPLHTDEVTFGVRSVELKDARFLLNGEPVRLVGLTRHADSPWHGLAETMTAMAQDYDDLKTLNMVFSRPVHYPQHESILDYCDRNGILLIPEVPAWQLNEYQMQSDQMRELEKQQLREMIRSDFNHPSIWAWSVGNEYESKTVAGYEFTRDMIEYVKSLDPTRPVGFASNRLGSDPEYDATELADFVMMNQYFGSWAAPKSGLSQALDDIHAAWPDKVVLISEFGLDSHWNSYWGPPSSALDPSEYYFIPEDVPGDSEEADVQRRLVIGEQMEVFRSKPFVAAAVFWTYQDYRSPSGFIMGVVDADRNRRGSWDVLRNEFAPVLLESVTFELPSGGNRSATVTLRTRGPVEQDMPAYIVRGYRLHWAVTSPDGQTLEEGEVALPTLEPGTEWAGEIQWPEPETEYAVTVRVLRPTGFPVIERTYESRGELYPES